MRQYMSVLRAGDFRRLWLGSTVSLIGDGMTFVALSWLVLAQTDGVSRLGLLGVCYTVPVVLGGLAVGPLLDRFDKRAVLIADSLVRAVAVATIPLTAAVGMMPDWLPFGVAAIYGLLKMVPLAGFPAAIPALVRETDLNAANALESLSFSLASMIGPVLAGVLISWIGPAGVLAVDAASFLVFALTAALVRRPLRPARQAAAPAPLRRLGRDRVIIVTTVAFMAFNIAEGMLLITAPWLAKHELPGGAGTLGALLASTAAGEFVGAAIAGNMRTERSPLRAIAMVQIPAACAYLLLLATPSQIAVGAGFFLVGLLSAPMTIWAQSLRMQRIPAELHGRAFALLRTLMQGTLPLGSALATPMLVHGQLALAATVMTLIAGLPGLALLTVRDGSRASSAQT
ncbi:MFS transporter [Lentzea sp. PSKA42]|uniref:MFS transporter n=2 Tax=Lentzea indica TaxID=2604800 RepID=A0ABX1FRU5_9PSEU|nr:MFS transporter [Lentzea indica]